MARSVFTPVTTFVKLSSSQTTCTSYTSACITLTDVHVHVHVGGHALFLSHSQGTSYTHTCGVRMNMTPFCPDETLFLWAAPIITSDETVGIGGDYKLTVNKPAKLKVHQLPCIKDILTSPSVNFICLMQVCLDKTSQQNVTVNTHGLL